MLDRIGMTQFEFCPTISCRFSSYVRYYIVDVMFSGAAREHSCHTNSPNDALELKKNTYIHHHIILSPSRNPSIWLFQNFATNAPPVRTH